MCKILKETEVTLETLAEHLEECGWNVEHEERRLILHTEKGLGFGVQLQEEKKFITLSTCLPISQNYLGALDLVNTLNDQVFLAGFCLDSDGDLYVSYQMIYERGLITSQFSRITRRFSGMLDYVVSDYDEENVVFDFKKNTQSTSDTSETPMLVQ